MGCLHTVSYTHLDVYKRQDSYYKDQSNLPFEERVKTNYDHPFAFDNELLVQQIKDLIDGKSIEKPVYDFSIHNRTKETKTVEPKMYSTWKEY